MLNNYSFQWDPEIVYKSILILEGGYENYILMYPMDCTNPNVRPPSNTATESQDPGHLDDIEYPSLADITMKDKSMGSDSNQSTTRPGGVPPTIDRNSKLAALKNYNSRKDLLKEQHEIAERLLASQQECLNEEIELVERIKNDAKDVEAEQDDDKEDKINESRFRIMQLDNSIEDAMLKKQLVEETKAVVPEKDPQETRDNMALADSIRQKEDEILAILEKRKRVAQERDEKLRLAKEQKKNLSLGTNKTNYSVYTPPAQLSGHVPSHPVVDRSVKPTVIAEWDDNIRRDFAPVYGPVVSTPVSIVSFVVCG